jgi:hypothetical protein
MIRLDAGLAPSPDGVERCSCDEALELRRQLGAALALLDRARWENHRHYPDDQVSLETWNEIDALLDEPPATVGKRAVNAG